MRDRPPDYPFRTSDHVEPISNTHAFGCECLNIAWESSKRLSWSSAPEKTLILATLVVNRIADIEDCKDFQLCRLFRHTDEVLTFHLNCQFLNDNRWFTRV